MKIRPVEAELFHAEGRTDDRDKTKLKVAFRNFANTPDKPQPEDQNRTVSNNGGLQSQHLNFRMFNLLLPATCFGNSLHRHHVDKTASKKKRHNATDYARFPFTSSPLKYIPQSSIRNKRQLEISATKDT